MVALLALGLHGVAVAGVVAWQAGLRPTRAPSVNAPEVTFFSPTPSTPAPAATPEPAAPKPAAPAPKVKRVEVVAPREIPAAVPEPSPQSEVVPEQPATTNDAETSDSGDTSSSGTDSTGTGTSTGDGPQGSDGSGTGDSREGAVLPFGEGMTRPECDRSLAPIEYTREAIEARVEGLLIIRCTIRVDGSVQNCQAIKGMPFMTEVALTQVAKWKCAPATFQGRPVNIDYFFNIRLVMPR
jgi:protein TonB